MSTVASQVEFKAGATLFGVCMFSLCLHEMSVFGLGYSFGASGIQTQAAVVYLFIKIIFIFSTKK